MARLLGREKLRLTGRRAGGGRSSSREAAVDRGVNRADDLYLA